MPNLRINDENEGAASLEDLGSVVLAVGVREVVIPGKVQDLEVDQGVVGDVCAQHTASESRERAEEGW